jgi:hypothetical protein
LLSTDVEIKFNLKRKEDVFMKRKLNLIRLNQEQSVEKDEMGKVYAGASTSICWVNSCACGCVYENQPGGSSTASNAVYNNTDVSGPLRSPDFTWENSTMYIKDFEDLQ